MNGLVSVEFEYEIAYGFANFASPNRGRLYSYNRPADTAADRVDNLWRELPTLGRGVLYGKTFAFSIFIILLSMTSSPDARITQLKDWLAALPVDIRPTPESWAPVSSDASARRYFRVSGPVSASGAPATLIAMDAPPPEKSREFVQVADLMTQAGLRVPQILAADVERGFMLLTDLGRQAYIDVLQGSRPDAQAQTLMLAALDTLIDWQKASRPDVLPEFDEAFLRREMELFPEWYLGRHLGLDPNGEALRTILDPIFALLVRSALAQPRVYMHRDFMPRNLMVAPLDGTQEAAAKRPGVLDFQDAVYGPIGYDPISLFRDALISWDEDFELDCLVRYWQNARAAGLPVREDFAEFYREMEWMGLQRHLKVLGIFARLQYRDGKPRYLADTPRFIAYARKVALRYRELAPLARLLDTIEGRGAQVGYTF